MKDVRALLALLSQKNGPSGFEDEVVACAAELLAPLVDSAYVDRFGNAVGILKGTGAEPKRLLVAAHLDEIGFLSTGTERGFIRFVPIGGIDPRMLPARELLFLTDPPLPGIVTCLPPHILDAEDMDSSFPMEDLYIDVGLSVQEAKRRIPAGTPAVYRADCGPLEGDRFFGKAMDNRACFCAALLALAMIREEGCSFEHDIVLLGSTREETNFGGAITGTFALDPDVCLALDVTHAETPDGGPKNTDCVLGGGPAVGYGPNMTPWVRDRLIDCAKEEGIDIQREVMAGKSFTDGWEMQIAREGIPTAILSLPNRYMHTPVEVISLTDLQSTADLLAAFFKQPFPMQREGQMR